MGMRKVFFRKIAKGGQEMAMIFGKGNLDALLYKKFFSCLLKMLKGGIPPPWEYNVYRGIMYVCVCVSIGVGARW